MSADIKVAQQEKASGLDSARVFDRTWTSSHGISFKTTEKTTCTSSESRHGSSSGVSPSAALAQQDEVKPSSRKQPSLSKADGDLRSSQSVQDIAFSTASFFEPNEQDRFSYAHVTVSSDPQVKESQDFKDPSTLPEGGMPPSDQPFYTPLGFHIPTGKLKTAKEATSSSPSAYWRYQLYQGPAGEHDKVKVHYCKNKIDTERIAQLFLSEKVIGFDIEWTMNATVGDGVRKNVALIQMASEQRVALFHIARYPNAEAKEDFVAPSLRKIMESPDITKAGVSIRGDCTRLRKYLDINCRGIFELSHLYKLVKYSNGDVKKINKTLVSLAEQVREHLGLPLWKGEVRSSDWSKDLNYQQIQYAASDSYAGFQLFHVLEAKRNALDPSPPRPAHAELNVPIKLADGLTAATFDETTESIEDSSDDSDSSSDISVAELISGVVGIDINNPRINHSLLASSTGTPSSQASSSTEKCISLPPSPELDLANRWITQYTSSNTAAHSGTTETKAKPAELRAYALWHKQCLSVPTIASLMRKPPLKDSTVANYIGKAIQSEGLPYKLDRISDLENASRVYGAMGVNWKKLRREAV